MEFRCCQKPDTQRKFWCLFHLSGVLDEPLWPIVDTNAPTVPNQWLWLGWKKSTKAQLIRGSWGSWYWSPWVTVTQDKENQATNVWEKLEARNCPSVHTKPTCIPPVQTQPGYSLWAPITHGHDLGCRVGDKPTPKWQEDPVLGVWVRLSSPGCRAAGCDQVWWQCKSA